MLFASFALFNVHCREPAITSLEVLYQTIEQHFLAGELAQAEAAWLKAPRQTQTEDKLWSTRLRLQQGRIRIYQGRSQEAVSLLGPAIPNGLHDSSLATKRSAFLSIAYVRTGDVPRAEHELELANQSSDNAQSRAEVLLAQGVISVEKGTLPQAEQAFQLSLASARAVNDAFQQCQALLNLGVVALRQEHYDDALNYFNQASVLAKQIGARLALEKAAGATGWTYYKLGDYQRALANSNLAEQQAVSLGVPIDQVGWLNDAGLSQYRLGDLIVARASYERSYRLATSLRNDEETGDALIALADLFFESGDLTSSYSRCEEALQIARRRGSVDATLRPLYLEALIIAKQGDRTQAIERLVTLRQKAASRQSMQWLIENAMARLFAESGNNLSADIWFRHAISTFRQQRSSVSSVESRLPFSENGKSLYLGYMEHLIATGKVDEALAILDQSRAETLAEALKPSSQIGGIRTPSATIDPRTVARHLKGTILVYSLRPTTSYLWAVSAEHTSFFRLPGQEKLLPLVKNYSRAILSSRDVLLESTSAGYDLYRQLVEPAKAQIKPQGKVFVIVDGGLEGFNFETLIASAERPHFWVEDVTITNARSFSLLANFRGPSVTTSTSRRLLLIGDPTYRLADYDRLPQAPQEVGLVSAHFQSSQREVITGPSANVEAYPASKPANFTYIHFVAHGTANETTPLDSAIILSPKSDTAESYKLYAREIMAQPIHADLVTISACYSSGTRSYAGEGLVGLAWAFLHAGSHNVIAALWNVSDASTPQLMSDLYDGLTSGSSPDEALRTAKLRMIHNGKIFRRPFYWAPFQLYSGAS